MRIWDVFHLDEDDKDDDRNEDIKNEIVDLQTAYMFHVIEMIYIWDIMEWDGKVVSKC
jgi:hypothetical protein